MAALSCVLMLLVGAALTISTNNEDKERALQKLQEVFGIAAPEGHQHTEVTPQFMIELYNTIADPDGVTHGRTPYNARVVRSFIERDNSRPQFFFFNISGLGENEKILEAELHLYRMRSPGQARSSTFLSSPDYLIHVYQVLDSDQLDIPDIHRLLNVHYVRAHDSGWQVFNVKEAVLAWTSGAAPNLGILVTASTPFGEDVNVRFARRNEHHNSKQPILVLFDDETKKKPISSSHEETSNFEQHYRNGYPSYFTYGDNAAHRNEIEDSDEYEEDSGLRGKRSIHSSSRMNRTRPTEGDDADSGNNGCSRRELYVNFADIGWSSWIVAPEGYSAYYCKGRCDFPLELSRHPTNHATVQSIVNKLGLVANVGKPCCVPNSLKNMSLLYVDENSNIVMKVYEDMIAASCGCH